MSSTQGTVGNSIVRDMRGALQHSRLKGYFDGGKRSEGVEVRGSIRYTGGRHKGVDLGGDPKGPTVKASMGKGDANYPVGICRKIIFRRTHLGDNFPPPKGKWEILRYWVGGSDMEGMRSSYECKTKEGGRVA